MTREMGREFELPKTYDSCCQLIFPIGTTRQTYTHCRDEVRGPLVETKSAGDALRHAVRHESLNDENDGYDSEVSQLVGVKLGGELGEDCKISC